jgi:apolipoprotein N-acyltransferase
MSPDLPQETGTRADLPRWCAVSVEPPATVPLRKVGKLWTLSPILAGLLCTLSVPPFGLWPLGIAGLGVLALTLAQYPTGPSAKQRAKNAMLFGLALYGPSLWWMAAFTLPGAIFVATLESAITALVFAFLPRKHAAALTPVGIVLADSLRSLWPFGGLPLGGLDLGQSTGPLARSAAYGGRLLVIGLAATLGTVGAFLTRSHFAKAGVDGDHGHGHDTTRNSTRTKLLAGLGVLLIAATALMWWAPTGTHNMGRSVRIAIVQGGGPRGNLASADNARRTFEAHFEATAQLKKQQGIDMVLWPENTVSVNKLETSREFARLLAQSRSLNAPFLLGVVEDADDKFALNEQAVLDPNGTVTERFEKVRRVPYGEYFPFRKTIEKYNLAPIPKRDFRPGTRAGTLDAVGTRFAVSISYEGFFDDRSRGGVRAGGRALLIPTNASSYTTTQVPTQQIAAARLRAIETGRWTVQAGPTGLSVVATPDGELRWRSELEKRETFVARIPLRDGFTPYVRFNDAPVLAVTLAALMLGYGSKIRASARERRSRY